MKRIQLKRGQRLSANTVRVDYTTKWRNPFTVHYQASTGEWVVKVTPNGYQYYTDRTEALHQSVKMFKTYLRYYSMPDIEKLRGKNLACWCKLDDPCHADVLLEYVNNKELIR